MTEGSQSHGTVVLLRAGDVFAMPGWLCMH